MRCTLRTLSVLSLTASFLGLAAPATATPSSPTSGPRDVSYSVPMSHMICFYIWAC